jgi:uncharacterized membrane protein
MESKETVRLEIFSDGVFAIAITLLILEIKVPHISSIHSNSDLWHELIELWPSYFAFVLTFGFILIVWICHHALFDLLDKTSPQLMFANGFLLLNVVFLPFSTATLAEYVMSEYPQPAVVFYCLSLLLTGIGWNLLYHFTLKPRALVKETIFIESVKSMQKNARYGLFVNVCITTLAWWFPLIALAINTLLWLFWMKESAAMIRHIKSSK